MYIRLGMGYPTSCDECSLYISIYGSYQRIYKHLTDSVISLHHNETYRLATLHGNNTIAINMEASFHAYNAECCDYMIVIIFTSGFPIPLDMFMSKENGLIFFWHPFLLMGEPLIRKSNIIPQIAILNTIL
ncbi:hypothetical protein ACJX0J_014605, partial [Zea mays]